MAQQRINVGSGDYSGDGESLRSAFTKTNANFDEVYTNIANILSTSTTDQLVNGNQHVVLGEDGKLTTPSNLQVDGGRIFLHPYGNAYIESVNYGITTSTSALNIFAGPDQKIQLRAGFGREAFWTFSTDGNLTLPAGGQIINLDIDGGNASV
jgi:hypothetical protein